MSHTESQKNMWCFLDLQFLALVHHSLGNRQPAAELAAVDGYTQAPDKQEGFADTALKRMERSKGLTDCYLRQGARPLKGNY